jgi:uncharacterized repeat protein (TIGR03803 family)
MKSIERISWLALGLATGLATREARADDAVQNLAATTAVYEPNPGLLVASDGTLYGTSQGYNSVNGAVFTLAPGSATTTVLYPFTGGQHVVSGLAEGPDGNLYGTIASGQAPVAKGAVFKLTKTGVYTTLHAFSGTDGANPAGPLLVASDGTLYGTTNTGGASAGNSWGTIFSIDPSGTFTTLYDFSTHDGTIYGKNARSRLIFGTDGTIYGTTAVGGTANQGTVFALAVDDTLSAVSLDSTIGYGPHDLLQACDGSIYGRAFGGNGVIFKLDPSSGIIGVLHGLTTTDGKFDANGGDGNTTGGALIEGANHSLFGVAQHGGSHNGGTIFELALDGTFTVHVNATIGPVGIAQGADGNLYGTAAGNQVFVDTLPAAERVAASCPAPAAGAPGAGQPRGTAGASGALEGGGTGGSTALGGGASGTSTGGAVDTGAPSGAAGSPGGAAMGVGAMPGGSGIASTSAKSGGCSLADSAPPTGAAGLGLAIAFLAALTLRHKERSR